MELKQRIERGISQAIYVAYVTEDMIAYTLRIETLLNKMKESKNLAINPTQLHKLLSTSYIDFRVYIKISASNIFLSPFCPLLFLKASANYN